MTNAEARTIVIATPHPRYDRLETALRERLDCEIVRFRAPETFTASRLAELNPRYVFLPHWSWKVPAEIHQAFECVIFHMTDLPFGRGGSPLQNLIVRGIASTRLTALRCVDEVDAGPIYLQRDLSLLGTAEEILMRAADLAVEMIERIAADHPQPSPQHGEPTFFKRRTPADGDLASALTLSQAYDWIRMLDAEGYPPAFVDVGRLRIEFSRASLKPGEVLAEVRIRLREGPE